MAVSSALPLAEAAAFTIGCLVLDARRFDSERTGTVLAAIVSALVLAVLIVATPAGALDTVGIDPDEVHSILE